MDEIQHKTTTTHGDPTLRVHPSAPDWSIHGPEEWASREYERKISGWYERQALYERERRWYVRLWRWLND